MCVCDREREIERKRNETYQMYFVNVPMGGASVLTKVMVEFGSRFFVFPNESLSRRKSKWS